MAHHVVTRFQVCVAPAPDPVTHSASDEGCRPRSTWRWISTRRPSGCQCRAPRVLFGQLLAASSHMHDTSAPPPPPCSSQSPQLRFRPSFGVDPPGGGGEGHWFIAVGITPPHITHSDTLFRTQPRAHSSLFATDFKRDAFKVPNAIVKGDNPGNTQETSDEQEHARCTGVALEGRGGGEGICAVHLRKGQERAGEKNHAHKSKVHRRGH